MVPLRLPVRSLVARAVLAVVAVCAGLLLSGGAAHAQTPLVDAADTLDATDAADAVELYPVETVHSWGADLRWSVYAGPSGVPFDRYEVHRSETQAFVPGAWTLRTIIRDRAVTYFHDTAAAAGKTFHYKVVANTSPSNERSVTTPPLDEHGQGQMEMVQQAAQPMDGNVAHITYLTARGNCENYGASRMLKVGADAQSLSRGLLAFGLRLVPWGTVITGASVSVYQGGAAPAVPVTVTLHQVRSSWREGTGDGACTGDGATWYEVQGGVHWSHLGGDFVAEPAASLTKPGAEGARWDTFDVTGLVQSWVDGAWPNHGVVLKLADETLADGRFVGYSSDDDPVRELRPVLRLSAVDGSTPQAPVVTVLEPRDGLGGAAYGTQVRLLAEAGDDFRVESLRFYIDGQAAPIAHATRVPDSWTWQAIWDSTSVPDGAHTLTAQATDDAGNVGVSQPVPVTVGNAGAPAVAITAPVAGATVGGTVRVEASASSGRRITRVEFFANGVEFSEDTKSPFRVSWDMTALPDGLHTLTARVHDIKPGSATERTALSAPVTLWIANGAPVRSPTPSLSPTPTPTPSATATSTPSATATAAPTATPTATTAASPAATSIPQGGTVVGWGSNSAGKASPPPGLSGVTAIAAGAFHSLALKADGTVVAWGSNSYGQASVPSGLTGVIAIAAGAANSLALRADGTVVEWGFGVPGRPAGLSGVTAIAAGGYHSLALRADGTVAAWGRDLYGQASVPAGLGGVIAVAAGTEHSLALRADGTVVGWGLNDSGLSSPPTGLGDVMAISASGNHNLALKRDGTLVSWGVFDQTTVPAGLSGVTAVSAGLNHSLALKSDGTVAAWLYWSYDDDGQAAVPPGLPGVTAVSAGERYSLALVGSGTATPPLPTPTSGNTATVTATVTPTRTTAPTATETPTASSTVTAIPSATSATTPTATATPPASPAASPTRSATPTPNPTASPTPSPTSTPGATPAAVPAAPSGLRVGTVTSDSIQALWTDNSSDEALFQVAYTALPLGSSPWRNAGARADQTSLTLGGLSPATSYGVVVRACNAAGCSVWSDPATGMTPP